MPKRDVIAKPLADNVVIARVSYGETEGGLLLPEQCKEYRAQVKGVGPDVKREIKVGDYVQMANYSRGVHVVDDEDVMVVGEDCIVAVLDFTADTKMKVIHEAS